MPVFAETGKDTLIEAIDSYNFLDYKDAILKAKRAVKVLKDPADLVSAYTYMGVSYVAQNKISKAIEAFARMVQIDPDATLDPSEFSPKFIKVFKRAKKRAGGKVVIVSKIAGASVDIDNHFVGKSGPGKPLKVDVVFGKHRIRVYREDYKPYKGKFKIDGSEIKRITPLLKKKKFGELEFVSNVSGGEIYIDGRKIKGKSLSLEKNTVLKKISAGKHQIEVRKVNYHPFKTEMVLTDLKKTIVSIDLQPVNGNLDIFIDKAGTEIFLGDRSYGKTGSQNDTVAIRSLRPGSYKVIGKLKGHITTEVPVEIGPGSSLRVKLFMKRGTFLTVNTLPPGASIIINGEERGKSPLSYPLKRGTIIRVRISLKGFYAPVMVFTMKGGRKLNIRMIEETAYKFYSEGRKNEAIFEKLLLDIKDRKKERLEQLIYQYIKQSVELYKNAIGEDREYAMAYSALAGILLKKVELDSINADTGGRTASKDIINTIVNSQKAISLNNDPLAKALSYHVLGGINLFKGNLEKRMEKKVSWLNEAVKSFDKAIKLFKVADISLDYSSVYLAKTYFKRALAFEEIARNQKTENTRARFAACEALRAYDFEGNHPAGSLKERVMTDLRKETEKHRVLFCQINHPAYIKK